MRGSAASGTLPGGSLVTVTLADGPGRPYDSIAVVRLGTPEVQTDWRFVNDTYSEGRSGIIEVGPERFRAVSLRNF